MKVKVTTSHSKGAVHVGHATFGAFYQGRFYEPGDVIDVPEGTKTIHQGTPDEEEVTYEELMRREVASEHQKFELIKDEEES